MRSQSLVKTMGELTRSKHPLRHRWPSLVAGAVSETVKCIRDYRAGDTLRGQIQTRGWWHLSRGCRLLIPAHSRCRIATDWAPHRTLGRYSRRTERVRDDSQWPPRAKKPQEVHNTSSV